MLNPVRDEKKGTYRVGERDDTLCDHGLSKSSGINVTKNQTKCNRYKYIVYIFVLHEN